MFLKVLDFLWVRKYTLIDLYLAKECDVIGFDETLCQIYHHPFFPGNCEETQDLCIMLFCGITIDHEIVTDTDHTLTVFSDAIHVFLEDVLADTETES